MQAQQSKLQRGSRVPFGGRATASRCTLSFQKANPRRCADVVCHVAAPPSLRLQEHEAMPDLSPAPLLEDDMPEMLVPDAPPLSIGNVVYGEVIFSNSLGSRVSLTYHGGLVGYMPFDQSPTYFPIVLSTSLNNSNYHNLSRRHGHQRRYNNGNDRNYENHRSQSQSHTSDSNVRGLHEDYQASEQGDPAPHSTLQEPHDHDRNQYRNNGNSYDRYNNRQGNQQRREGSAKGQRPRPVLPVGHARPFKVVSIPNDGRGPLLSAVKYDLDVVTTRLEQLLHVADEEMMTFPATVEGANAGGLLLTMLGMVQNVFMPYSMVHWRRKSRLSNGWDMESAQELVGAEMDVALVQVVPATCKVVVSQRLALERRRKRVLKLGNVLAGTIKKVFEYGAYLQLDALPWSDALLKVENISQARHPDNIHDVFQEGDRVTGLLSQIGEHHGEERLQLSTLELEQTPGDMLLGPESREQCYSAVARYLVH